MIRKQFSRYPALWIAAFYVTGIAAGWYFPDRWSISALLYSALVLFGLGLLFYFCCHKLIPYILGTLLVVLGALNLILALSAFASNHLLNYDHRPCIAFEGWISETHYRKDGRHQYILECTRWYESDSISHAVSGKILLRQSDEDAPFDYGDQVYVMGRPEQPPLPGNPGEMNYRRHWQLNGIYHQFYLSSKVYYELRPDRAGNFWQAEVLVPLRLFILRAVDGHIPEPTADVVKALVLGERQDIDRSIVENFQKTGIIHILAISGLHVGFILLILLMLFSFLPVSYNGRILLTLFFLFVFVALVDFKAPVLRASLMAAFYFFSRMSERPGNALNIIATAGLLILFFQPQQLFQPGFQFSFAAVGAIIYGYPRLSQWLPRNNRFKGAHLFNKWIGQPFWVSTAAIIGTTPLTWWYYGSFQLGAFLINILIIPLIGMFVIMNFIFLFAAGLHLPVVAGLGQLLHGYFMGILSLVDNFSVLPLVQIPLPQPNVWQLLLLILAIFLFFKLKGNRRIIYPLLLIAAILVIARIPADGKGRLEVTFVNVGQGDAAILRFPNDAFMIIDGGDRKANLDAGERYMVPVLRYYGIERIKYLVGSHAHSDHIGGLETILDHVRVDTLVLPNYPSQTGIYRSLLQKAGVKQVPIAFRERGQQLFPDPDCRVYILHPYGTYQQTGDRSGREVNNSSLVLKIVYGQTGFLFTGDLESNAETDLLGYASFLKSDVLKVGHHGSKTSTSPAFLEWIQPQMGIVSVGRFNKFKHPSKQKMELLKDQDVAVLRTDHLGALVCVSDGQRVSLYNWRR